MSRNYFWKGEVLKYEKEKNSSGTIGGITASRSSAGGDKCGASENCINKHNRTVFVRLSCKCNIFGRCRCEPCYDADMDRGKRTG